MGSWGEMTGPVQRSHTVVEEEAGRGKTPADSAERMSGWGSLAEAAVQTGAEGERRPVGDWPALHEQSERRQRNG